MAATVQIAILANAAKARAELNSVGSTAGRQQARIDKFKNGVKTGLLAAGGAAVLFAKAAVSSASQAQQSLGATQTVFGSMAGKVVADSKRAADAYGLSANQYRENANLLGSLFKNQGVATDQLAGKTRSMIARGADLAATFGGTTREAVEALGSAFKGEFDPLERYGISIKQSSVNAELAARGQDKLKGAALRQATQQATTALIMRQSAASQGQFGRESSTLAGQQERLAAKFENVKAAVGAQLLPVLTKLLQVVSQVVAVTGRHRTAVLVILGVLAGLAAAVLAVNGAMAVAGAATATYTAVTAASAAVQRAATAASLGTRIGLAALAVQQAVVAGATKAYTAVQWLLNAAMTANPIGLLVVAIVALVAAFVIAYKKSETFRNIVNATFGAIRNFVVGAVKFVVNFVKSHWLLLIAIIGGPLGAIVALVIKNWDKIKSVVRTAIAVVKAAISLGFNTAKNIVSTAWHAITTVISTAIGRAVGLARGIKGRILGALGNVRGWLLNAGKSIIQGLIDGIRAMGGAVKDAVGSVLKGARNLLPFSPAREGPFSGRGWTLYSGRSISEGLAAGMTSRTSTVRAAALDIARAAIPTAGVSLARVDTATLAATRGTISTGAAGRGSTGGTSVSVKLTAEQLTAVQRGKAVQIDLDAYAAAGGRGRA